MAAARFRSTGAAGITHFTRPPIYLRRWSRGARIFISAGSIVNTVIPPARSIPEDIEEYLRTYRQPGALRAGFAYYRALDRDVAHNQTLIARGKLTMPVLALGGGKAFGRGVETLESLKRVATDVRGGVIEDCGHWMAEEKPEAVARAVLEFFAEQ
jgi:pimeloyl-ACP methyl ester carboxylesterase